MSKIKILKTDQVFEDIDTIVNFSKNKAECLSKTIYILYNNMYIVDITFLLSYAGSPWHTDDRLTQKFWEKSTRPQLLLGCLVWSD